MGKVVGKIMMVLIPILVVIGIFRVAVHGGDVNSFVPSWPEFVGYMASAPDPYSMILEPIDIFNASVETMNAFEITDIATFFEAIGNFFNVVGNAFSLGFAVISVPFRYIGWFMSFIAGFSS